MEVVAALCSSDVKDHFLQTPNRLERSIETAEAVAMATHIQKMTNVRTTTRTIFTVLVLTS